MLDSFLDEAWRDHADHPADVAARLLPALDWVHDDDAVTRLALLAHHLYGEHLAQWPAGLGFLQRLAQRHPPGADAAATLARCVASLELSGGMADGRPAMGPSDRCRVSAMAAANLARPDVSRAGALLSDAAALAASLPDADPAVRALAAHANNMAGTLQAQAARSDAQRALMIDAAMVARIQWERAGTWLEVERAEHRLAVCWLAHGDAARALQHARRCEAIVREHEAPPLELFFAAEALCLAGRALGDVELQATAQAVARHAFEALPADDQAWCRETLEGIGAGGP